MDGNDHGREETRPKKRKLEIDGGSPDVYDELMLTTVRRARCAQAEPTGACATIMQASVAAKQKKLRESVARLAARAAAAVRRRAAAARRQAARPRGGKSRGKKRGKQMAHGRWREQQWEKE